MRKALLILGVAACGSGAVAAFSPITNVTFTTVGGFPEKYFLTSLTTVSAGVAYKVTAAELCNGTTTCLEPVPRYLARMDNFDLNDLATGFSSSSLPIRTVLFGGAPAIIFDNGSAPDFFLFEAASFGNPDDIQIAAIFADDTLGASVVAPTNYASGWGDTGFDTLPGGSTMPVDIAGLAWDVTDLKDAAGANLTATAIIKGIAITSGPGIDPLALFAFGPPSGIHHFAVVTSAGSPHPAGVEFEIVVTAQDAAGETVDNNSTLVMLASPGSLMEFDWNGDGTYGDHRGLLSAGTKTIKARNKRAETATIVASVGAITTPAPPSVTTAALAFSRLQVVAPGQTAAPGTDTGVIGNPDIHSVGLAFSVTVNAVDAYWNPIVAAPGDTILVINSDITATVSDPAALIAGKGTFTTTFNQRGVFNITATNLSNAGIATGFVTLIASMPLFWVGDGSANLWDISTFNWANSAGMPFAYANGDEVVFDDNGSLTPEVNIAGIVAPRFLTVDAANDYTLGSTTAGGIGGQLQLRKSGAGTLTLATSNSYTGGTFASGGRLVLSNAYALPASGTLTMSNCTLVAAATNIIRSNLTVRGTTVGFSAAGANRSVNFGNLSWGGTGNNLFEGGGDCAIVLCRSTDSFTLDFQSQIDFLANPGRKIIRVEDGAAAVDALISGKIQDITGNPGILVKTGSGTLQLANPASNYTVPTEIWDGTLIITGGSMDRDNAFILGNGETSAVLQLGNEHTNYNLTVGSLTTSGTGSGNRVAGGHTSVSRLTVNANLDVAFEGVLGGPALNQNNLALTKSGIGSTLNLLNSNTYSGPTVISAGALALTSPGSINNTAEINVMSGSAFDVRLVLEGYVLGPAQTLRGGGTVSGDVTGKGRIAPGSPNIGTLTFSDNLTLSGSDVLMVMEIDRTNTPNCDALCVLGTFTPAGTLIITNLGSPAALVDGDTFQLFSSGVSGFSRVQLPPTPPGLTWTNKLATDGSISLLATCAPPPGITIRLSEDCIHLTWPADQGCTLQTATNITGPWDNLSGATSPYEQPTTNAAQFFRLKQ